jgi:PAS domain S-box-containing protein
MLEITSAKAPIALENAFEKLFVQSPMGMAISSMDEGRFIEVNAAYCAITGYQRDELLDHTSAELGLIDPQSRALILEHVSLDGFVRNIDVQLRSKRGETIIVVTSIHRARVNGIDCFMTSLIDVTLSRKTKADLKSLNETLEQRVIERTATLENALERLAQSSDQLTRSEAKATLNTLVASVAHELGTPLGNGALAAETLSQDAKAFSKRMEHGALTRKELSDFVASVLTGADLTRRNLSRADELLQNFKQVAADQASEQRRSFSLAEVMEDTLQAMAPSLKRQPHRVDMRVPPHIVMHSQPGAIGQVAVNLINNAYLHAFENKADGVLTIDAELKDGQVTLRFADNGIGIAPAHLEKLFKAFFSTKIGQGGTGLGMAIVENLVTQSLGGSIQVHTEVGVGTTFEITLPQTLPAAN